MLSLEDIQDILRIKLIGVIPESENVLTASNQGTPAVHLKGTDVSEAYKDVIDRFLGKTSRCASSTRRRAAFSSACSGEIRHGVLPVLPAR